MRFRGQGLQLNRAHPLARGLVAYVVFHNGIGYDLVSRKTFSTLAGTPGPGRTQEGIGLDVSGGSAISSTDWPSWNVLGDLTVAWRGIVRSTAAAGNFICKVPFAGNGATNTAFSFEYTNPTANRLSLARSNTNYRVWQSGSDLVRAGALQTFSVSQAADISTTPVFYADGRPDTAAAANQYGGAGSGPPTSVNYDMLIGRRPDNAEQLNGIAMVAAVAARQWSAAEHALFNDDPYALIVGGSRPLDATADVTVGLTGVAGTFSRGTLTPSSAKGLTGQAGTFGQGVVTPSGGDLSATDTHDGVTKRSRRQRKLQAVEARRRDELAAEATALRLSLEAAMGLAAEVIEDAPAPVVAKIEAAQQKAAPIVARPVVDAKTVAATRVAVADLQTAIAEAARAKALADDDEDVAFILGMV